MCLWPINLYKLFNFSDDCYKGSSYKILWCNTKDPMPSSRRGKNSPNSPKWKKNPNKKITSFLRSTFYQKIAKILAKIVKNLWWNLGLAILCAYSCFYTGVVWFLDLGFKGLFVLKDLNLRLLHEWCNHHARGIALAEHFPACLLKFNCCMADD